MSKIFENSRTLRREREFAEYIGKKSGLEPFKIDGLAEIDYQFIKDGKIVLLTELKCRNNPRSQYPTYRISTNKLYKGVALSKETGIHFVIFIRWTDSDGYLWIKEIDPRWRVQKEWHDERLHMDELIYIPISLFKPYPPKN